MSHHLQAEKNTIQIDERLQMPQMVAIAADLAQHILDSDPDRLAHSKAAARRAEFLTLAVEPECAALLVAAAWLHDIGYAPGLRDTGFHPIDGARHLQTIGWPPAICNLVAHHSGARFVARVLQLDRQLEAYPFSQDTVSDALTVADQTTGPHGEAMTIEERMRDMLRRHGPDSPNALAHPLREPYVRAAASRVAERLEHTGIDPRPPPHPHHGPERPLTAVRTAYATPPVLPFFHRSPFRKRRRWWCAGRGRPLLPAGG